MTYHVQCRLSRGPERTVAWLPEKKAVVGKVLRIDGLGDGWRVETADTRRPTTEVRVRSADYRKTRAASDI